MHIFFWIIATNFDNNYANLLINLLNYEVKFQRILFLSSILHFVICKDKAEKENFDADCSRVSIFSNTYCEFLEVNNEALLNFPAIISAFQALALKDRFLPNLWALFERS